MNLLFLPEACFHIFFNSLRPRQNGRHFTDNTVKYIFVNENVLISIKISLKFVPMGPINNIHALVQIIGKTPVRIILWCPITKMLIKACFLVQPLQQEGLYQKCCISLCSKVFINHFYQMKASPECLNILTYCSKYWVDRLRRTIERKV